MLQNQARKITWAVDYRCSHSIQWIRCTTFLDELQKKDLLQTQQHKIWLKMPKVRSFVWDCMAIKYRSGNYFS